LFVSVDLILRGQSAAIGTTPDTDRRHARAASTEATPHGPGPPSLTREQAVRRAEVRPLALVIHDFDSQRQRGGRESARSKAYHVVSGRAL